MRSTLLALSLAGLAILALASCGAATSKERCGSTLLTGKICGDDLVSWCEDRYDPDLNGETCEPALDEAGQNPDDVLAAIKAVEADKEAAAAKRNKAAADKAEEDARVTVASGEAGDVGDVSMTVSDPEFRQEVGGDYSTQQAKAGRRFAVLRVDIHNGGNEPLSACGFEGNAQLVDGGGKLYSADMEASTYEGDAAACTDDIQPDDDLTVPVVFDLRDAVKPVGAVVWPPGFSTQATDPHLLVAFTAPKDDA